MYSVELVDPLLLLSYNNVYGVFVKHAHEHCGIVCVLCQLQVHKPSLSVFILIISSVSYTPSLVPRPSYFVGFEK